MADYEMEDSRRLFEDFVFFHDLGLRASDCRLEYDASRRIYSSSPWELVGNLLNSIAGTAVINELAGRYDWRDWRAKRANSRALSLISEATVEAALEIVHRATFHQLFCDAVGLVYDPSFARFPAISHFARNGTQIALALADVQQLEDLLGERLQGVAQALGEVPPQIVIPPYTAYVLAKAGTLDDWWPIAGELRRKAAKYRRIRGEIREALYVRDVKLLRSLREELIDECSKNLDRNLADRAGAGIRSAVGATTVVPGATAVFAGPIREAVQSALRKPTVKAVRAIRRRLRPELRLFHHVGHVASSYLNNENKISLLWETGGVRPKIAELAGYAERYETIATRRV